MTLKPPQLPLGGWFHSGDAAVVHRDGYIEIRDRYKGVIISGRENISSIEVESALLRHSAVLEAAVTVVPHEKWGESPEAFLHYVLEPPRRRWRYGHFFGVYWHISKFRQHSNLLRSCRRPQPEKF